MGGLVRLPCVVRLVVALPLDEHLHPPRPGDADPAKPLRRVTVPKSGKIIFLGDLFCILRTSGGADTAPELVTSPPLVVLSISEWGHGGPRPVRT